MPSSRASSIRPRVAAVAAPPDVTSPDGKLDPERVSRAIAALGTSVERLAGELETVYVEATLATGTNRIDHALGRRPVAVLIVPKTPSAAFAAGFDWTQPLNPTPNRTAWIEVVGGPMVCRLIFL